MVDLHLHGRRVRSVFELLGLKENDVTYSIGWALARSPAFRETLMRRIFPDAKGGDYEVETVALQQYEKGAGKTDIELRGPLVHVIIEAKRGWYPPSDGQLSKYRCRMSEPCKLRALVSMAECTAEHAARHLRKEIEGVAVKHIPWREVQQLAHVKQGRHAEKRLLAQLRLYLERIVKLQNKQSNWVYVVALGSGRPEWSELSWIDIVREKRRYFHPVGIKSWPKEPPNYIAFRYSGRLQSIHHIEKWDIVDHETVREFLPEVRPTQWVPHYLYRLGPPIMPPKTVKTGAIYPNGRVWAMLDLLLTCDSISEARDRSKQRVADAEMNDEV